MKFHCTTLLIGVMDKTLQVVFKSPLQFLEMAYTATLVYPLASNNRGLCPLVKHDQLLLDLLGNRFFFSNGKILRVQKKWTKIKWPLFQLQITQDSLLQVHRDDSPLANFQHGCFREMQQSIWASLNVILRILPFGSTPCEKE